MTDQQTTAVIWSHIERAAQRVARSAARLILAQMKARGRTPLTQRQRDLYHVLRRKLAARTDDFITLEEAIESFDGRVLPGLFIRGLVRWRMVGGAIVLEQKEPDEP